MPRKRPTAVLVIAILNFVVAGLGACTLVLQTPALQAQFKKMAQAGDARQAQAQEQMERELEKIPGYHTYQAVEVGRYVLFTVMLIAGGVGLLLMQPWGRSVCIAYAVLSILHKIGTGIYSVLVIVPALEPLFAQLGKQDPQQAQVARIGGMIGAVGAICVGAIYPIIVLIFMLLPSIAAAFRAAPTDYRRDEGEEDQFERERDLGWGDVPPEAGPRREPPP
jgi:hypothetical protein